ncbi:MAG: helix-turn-helix domain-containing protein [Nibricoccus sp.]
MAKSAGIPEGFRDQHLVVLPASVRKAAEKHPLLRGLLVTDTGVFPRAAEHLVSRPRGIATSLVILCTAGRGWVEIAGQKYTAQPGSLLWIPARQPHAYGADSETPWTIEWTHFTGEESDAWREFLQLPPNGGLFTLSPSTFVNLRFSQIWEYLERGYSLPNLVAASNALRTTFIALSQPATASSRHERTADERVASSIPWMQSHLAQSIRLEELAQLAGVSVPHYCTLFKRQTGFAPIDWLIRLRIQRACQLLDTTNEAIATIGARAGFPNPFYFTRCFRRIMGHPPRDYRRVTKG